jgi:hypothetical protein
LHNSTVHYQSTNKHIKRRLLSDNLKSKTALITGQLVTKMISEKKKNHMKFKQKHHILQLHNTLTRTSREEDKASAMHFCALRTTPSPTGQGVRNSKQLILEVISSQIRMRLQLARRLKPDTGSCIHDLLSYCIHCHLHNMHMYYVLCRIRSDIIICICAYVYHCAELSQTKVCASTTSFSPCIHSHLHLCILFTTPYDVATYM